MRIVLLLLLILITWPLLAKDVYKWTNESGEVVYSDTYRDGAERIRVSGSRSSPSSAPDTTEGSTSPESEVEGVTYQSFEVVQPENDQTIRSNEGTVNVGLALSPALAANHAIHVFLDGNRLEGEMKSTQFSLNNLNRGTHSLEVKVVDDKGNALTSAPAVNFHLRKASIIKP
ncbi:MAG: DUF4124 domain-containing protein [Candidatus Thiodiazotropha sp. (ex Monitilora ramsayi)]|nr:DUF4124 domain-containing protein [Candidatus Thiodiazotropha sp. (ex Monitilora ramsayi)]